MEKRMQGEDKNPMIMVEELTIEQLYQRLHEGFDQIAIPNATHLESGRIYTTH